MKKIASLILGLALVLGLAAPALASELTVLDDTTAVSYTAAGGGTGTSGGSDGYYTITVPTSLVAGGESGTVSVTGAWPSTKLLVVQADQTIQMTNAASTETVNVPVDFDGISKTGAGSTTEVSDSATIRVGEPEVLIGTWSGQITYSAGLVDPSVTGIKVTTQPTLQSYLVGDRFNPAGLALAFTYNNNTEVAFSSSDMDNVTYSVTTFTADQETAVANNFHNCDVTVTYTDSSDSSKTYTTTVTVKLWPAQYTGTGQVNLVNSITEWFALRELVENGGIAPNVAIAWSGGNDDFESYDCYSLGSEKCPFRGTIDFRGNTLKNVAMGTSTSVAGFFGCVGDGATIKHLTLNSFAGDSFIETASGNVMLENVHIINGVMTNLINTVSSGNVTIKNSSLSNTSISYIIGTVNTGAAVTFTGKCEVSNCGSPSLKESGEGTVTGLTLS